MPQPHLLNTITYKFAMPEQMHKKLFPCKRVTATANWICIHTVFFPSGRLEGPPVAMVAQSWRDEDTHIFNLMPKWLKTKK